MNHIYKVVWSKVKNAYVVGSEFISSAQGRGEYKAKSSCTGKALERLVIAALVAGAFAFPLGTASYAADNTPTVDDYVNAGLVPGTVAGTGNLILGDAANVTETSWLWNKATASDNLVIGQGATVAAQSSLKYTGTVSGAIAIGKDAKVNAFGQSYNADASGSIAIGQGSLVTAKNSVAIGAGSTVLSEDNVVSVDSANQQRKIINVADGDVDKNSIDAVNGKQLYQYAGDKQYTSTNYVKTDNDLTTAVSALDKQVGTNAAAIAASTETNEALTKAGVIGGNIYDNSGSDNTSGSLAIGKDSIVTSVNSAGVPGNGTAIGNGAKVNNSAVNSTAIGQGAIVTASNATALGQNARVVANPGVDGSVALGQDSFVGYGDSTTDEKHGVVSVGQSGKDGFTRRIINVGSGTISATSTDAVNGSDVYKQVGMVSKLEKSGIVDEDKDPVENLTDAAVANHKDITSLQSSTKTLSGKFDDFARAGVVVQKGTYAGSNSMQLGNQASAPGQNSLALGYSAKVSGEKLEEDIQTRDKNNGTAVGVLSSVTGLNSTAVGEEAQAYGDKITAVGQNSKVISSDNSTALGADTRIDAADSTAVGQGASIKSQYSTALGQGAFVGGTNEGGQDATMSTALGANSTIADGAYSSTTVGAGSRVGAANSTIIGQGSTASKANATAVGQGVSLYGEDSAALGTGVTSYGKESVAIGKQALVNFGADDATAVGFKAEVDAANSVALGANSIVTTTDLLKDDKGNVTEKNGVVSVGTKSAQRRIINVANGVNDSDAATYGQVKAVKNAVADLGDAGIEAGTVTGKTTSDNTAIGSGAAITGDADNGNVTHNVAIGAGATVEAGFDYSDTGVKRADNVTYATAVGAGADATGNGSTAIGAESKTANDFSTAIGRSASAGQGAGNKATALGYNAHANEGNALALGANSDASVANGTAIGTDASLSYGATNSVALGADSKATEANTVSVGAKGSERKIVNVASGVNDTDAVNMKQFNTAVTYDTKADGSIDYDSVSFKTTDKWTGTTLKNVADIQMPGTKADEPLSFKASGILPGSVQKDSEDAVALRGSVFSKFGGIAIGRNASTGSVKDDRADYGVALGYSAQANVGNSVAIGHEATITAGVPDGSVAIGAGSRVADDVLSGSKDAVVSFGSGDKDSHYGATRRLINVSDGIADTDAATVGQISKITGLDSQKGNVVQYDGTDKSSVTFAGANGTILKNADMEFTYKNPSGTKNVTATFKGSGMLPGVNSAANGVAIGQNATINTDANSSVVVGVNSSTYGEKSTVIGQGITAFGDNSVAIGQGVSAFGAGATAVGQGSDASGENSVAIGKGSKVSADNSIAIGGTSQSTGSVASSATESTVVGVNAYSGSQGGAILGQGAMIQGSAANSTAVGNGAYVGIYAANSTALGANSYVVKDDLLKDGKGNVTETNGVVSVGRTPGANGKKDDAGITRRIINVADGVNDSDAATVGQISKITGLDANKGNVVQYDGADKSSVTFAGSGTTLNNVNDVVFNMKGGADRGLVGSGITPGQVYNAANGWNEQAAGDTASLAIGGGILNSQTTAASVRGKNSVAIGSGAKVDIADATDFENANAVAIGVGANVSGIQSTAVGKGSKASGKQTTAVGEQASAEADGAVAFGQNSHALSANSTVLGTGANVGANAGASVALGAGSNVFSSDLQDGEKGVVSVGSSSDKRRIINVADGVKDTDAATVGQISKITGLDANKGNVVQYDSANKSSVTFAGVNGTTLKGVKDIELGGSSFVAAGLVPGTVSASNPSSANNTAIGGSITVDGENGYAKDNTALGAGASVEAGYDWSGTSPVKKTGVAGSTAIGAGADVTGSSSTAVGAGAVTSNDFSTAIGYGAKAGISGKDKKGNATAIGYNAQAAVDDGMALGSNSRVYADGGIAIGSNASVSYGALQSVAIGNDASVRKASGTAIGQGTTVSSDYSTVLGQGATVGGTNAGGQDAKMSTALGANSVVADGAYNSTIVGAGSQANAANVTVLGQGSSADKANSTAVGEGVHLYGEDSAALGAGVTSYGKESVAIGKQALVNFGADDATAIGFKAEVDAANSVALGANSIVTQYDLLTDDKGNVTEKNGVVSVGSASAQRRIINVADGVNATDAATVGQISKITGLDANKGNVVQYDSANKSSVTFAGTNGTTLKGVKDIEFGGSSFVAAGLVPGTVSASNPSSTNNTAIGGSITVDGENGYAKDNTALGAGASVEAGYDWSGTSPVKKDGVTGSTAIGAGADVTGSSSTAVGAGAVVSNDFSTAIGYGAKAGISGKNNKGNATAIGYNAQAAVDDGTALGSNSRVYADGGIAIGSNASVSYGALNAVAIGSGSSANEANTFSVGSSSNQRRIVNVADGQGLHDAATVGQIQKITGVDVSKGNVVQYDGDNLNAGTASSGKLNLSAADGSAAISSQDGASKVTTTKDNATLAHGDNSVVVGADGTTVNGNLNVNGDFSINGSTLATKDDITTVSKGLGSLQFKDTNAKDLTEAVNNNYDAIQTNTADIKKNSEAITATKEHIGVDDKGNFAKIDNGADTLTGGINANTSAIKENSDAINSLGHSVSKLGDEVDSVGAISAALAGLHPLDYTGSDSKYQISAALGTYDGTQAFALGGFYNANRNVLLSFGVSSSLNGERKTAGNIGATFRVGAGNSEAIPENAQDMRSEIVSLKAENATQKARMDEMEKQIQELLKANAKK